MPEQDADDWRATERRRSGYTIWKEILGTAAVVLPVALIFAAWLTGIDKQTALNTVAIATMRETWSQQRLEVQQRLEKMDDKLDRLLVQSTRAEMRANGR